MEPPPWSVWEADEVSATFEQILLPMLSSRPREELEEEPNELATDMATAMFV